MGHSSKVLLAIDTQNATKGRGLWRNIINTKNLLKHFTNLYGMHICIYSSCYD